MEFLADSATFDSIVETAISLDRNDQFFVENAFVDDHGVDDPVSKLNKALNARFPSKQFLIAWLPETNQLEVKRTY